MSVKLIHTEVVTPSIQLDRAIQRAKTMNMEDAVIVLQAIRDVYYNERVDEVVVSALMNVVFHDTHACSKCGKPMDGSYLAMTVDVDADCDGVVREALQLCMQCFGEIAELEV